MKVAMIGPELQAKGGIASVIRNFKEYFQNPAIDIVYYATWKEGNFWQRLINTIKCFIQFSFYIRSEKIDIVHLHVAQSGSFYRKSIFHLIAKQRNCKTIIHMHASQFDQFYEKKTRYGKKYIQWFFQKADKVVVLSEEWRFFYEKIYLRDYLVIENAVAVPMDNTYNKDAKNIVSFGRLGKRKGSYDILEVAKKFQLSFPEILFILYGDGDVSEIKDKIAQLGLKNVQVGGWVASNELSELMKESKIHLLPSYQEGMPMAILETMAHGIPNISTVVGGIPQVIETGVSGLLIEPGNLDEMVQAIQTLLEDSELLSAISEAGYQKIKEKFSISTYHQKWQNLYMGLKE